MSTFDERQKRFEGEFAHNQELKFKVEARRDKIVGAWAAEQLGLSDKEAEEYAASVVRADLEEPGDDDVFRKLRKDLDEARKSISDETIRDEMSKALQEAMDQLAGN